MKKYKRNVAPFFTLLLTLLLKNIGPKTPVNQENKLLISSKIRKDAKGKDRNFML